jgi:UDP-2,4-diacetamido-2,4,6-trideoxy-beta-L-altropyranose hydrolase
VNDVRLRVAFRCDASLQMGGGHVMRCLALADALSNDGADVSFVAAEMPDALARRVAQAGHLLTFVPPAAAMPRADQGWEEPPLTALSQQEDATATGAAVRRVDWAVVDHYLLDKAWHSTARNFADKILVIDDLANRSCDCDLLLDQTFGRKAADYRARVPSGAHVLTGSAFALLRPEFAGERAAALERRAAAAPVRRVLIAIGTSDHGDAAARIAEEVLTILPECAIDLVLAVDSGEVRRLASGQPRITVHLDSERMAELMRDADTAIGAAGTSSWERCCLGLPAILLVIADNQRFVAANLKQAGAVLVADSIAEIPALLKRLADDPGQRLAMTAAAAAIVDGQGARRVAAAMLGTDSRPNQKLTLRPAEPDDSRSVWIWRNDPVTRRFSQMSDPIAWPDHQRWWNDALNSAHRQLMIAEVDGEPVAVVRFDRSDPDSELSINLAPACRGSGLGGQVLGKACEWFRETHRSERLVATIHRGNAASQRIFEQAGFVRSGGLSNPDFDRYVLAEGTVE